ncbi:MAG: hypothetical protein IJQ21_08690 [Lachnospiraceae bacterium]|nr:hypothetical protein [Lachnospiraceae bacterium]
MSKLELPQVTLVAMTSVNIDATIRAMLYSMRNGRGIRFGDAVLITHEKPARLPDCIRYAHIDRLKEIDDFNYHMVYDLGDYIETDFAMVVHADGFVVHPEKWRDDFLAYDYIGSPWPLPDAGDTTSYRDINGTVHRVGNSVSIRSKRLMTFPKKNNVPWVGEYAFGRMWYNEDGFITTKIRHLLEADGMRIAPLELAVYFGHETMIPEIEGITPFCFHKWNGTNSRYPDFTKTAPAYRLQHLGAFLKTRY